MSYCRFSSDDFQCDVYCYEHCHGFFVTHVAGNRLVYDEPLPPPIDISDADAWLARHQKVQLMIDRAERVMINLPGAGETYEDVSLGDMLIRLQGLKAVGFIVPDHAFERIAAEMAEEEENGES